MISELQTRARQAGNTIRLFRDMVTAASQRLDLEPRDVAAISQAAEAMAEDLEELIADLTSWSADQNQISHLRSLLQDLRSADEMVRRKVGGP